MEGDKKKVSNGSDSLGMITGIAGYEIMYSYHQSSFLQENSGEAMHVLERMLETTMPVWHNQSQF